MKLSLFLLLSISLSIKVSSISCPNITATSETKPLYLLLLVPFPDSQDSAGWDGGLEVLSGARVARDEINNRTDLLPGYHIELIVENIEACSRTEAGIGLSNLVKYTVNPPCRPVVAVTGLVCSSHTSVLSPVAGHDGFDLIQLSAANSPIFKLQNSTFPHLWHFLGSATAYSDALLAIMDQYNWKKIGVVYDLGSLFFSECMVYLEQNIKASRNKSIEVSVSVRGVKLVYFKQAISDIKSKGVAIVVVLLNPEQSSVLLSQALDNQLVYPRYTWIHYETTLQYLMNQGGTDRDTLFSAVTGHILLHTQIKLPNVSKLLHSGVDYNTFERKYFNDLEGIKSDYNVSDINSDLTFASYMYDQIWAFALAVNDSLFIMGGRNLSIDNYTIGQPEITKIIEEQLAMLSFQGAGGLVKFDEYHSVSTPVEVIWALKNGTEKRVGLYNPVGPSDFRIYINASDLSNDTVSPIYDYAFISLTGAIILYIIIGTLIISTTLQLILYLYYRNHKIVKATSPYLSLLVFAGCYLLCTVATLKLTYGTFYVPKETFKKILWINVALALNGFGLILITLFIKLLRVYRIFSSRLKKDLGKYWSNFPLLLTIIFLTIVPNIVVLPLITIHLFKESTGHFVPVIHVHADLQSPDYFLIGGLIAGYITVFSFVIVYLAVHTRNIRQKNFKDTKKLNLFIFILTFTLAMTAPLYIIFLVTENEPAANATFVVGIIVILAASQFILFLPKVLPIVLSSFYPVLERDYSANIILTAVITGRQAFIK